MSFADEGVDVIDPGCDDLDNGLVGPGRRQGPLLQPQHIRAAGAVVLDDPGGRGDLYDGPASPLAVERFKATPAGDG
ncbi:hypothetical protein RYJ27_07515 [Microbacterium limosum]|uniref:Uncharacterized protein n=1 Tax=Microbacterium limosum TaxID=3079935 RepID=A0AAU0MEK7_9MICO|nr:hypothetical protein [Microbacterium sp. Y20]WOQ68576.1 hypothetical protein RYJ27_07515 [Microbacterium sp. Y20]